MTFIYFLISAVLFYYLFKIGVRLLMPFFMRKMAERIMKAGQGQYANTGQNQQNYNDPFTQFKQQQRPDGKVHVDYMPPKQDKPKKGTETAGEFIDFEEVK